MDIKENIIQPTKDTVLLGMNECLGGIKVQELADLIKSLNSVNSGTIMSYKYVGPGDCATRGNITGRGFNENEYVSSRLFKISIAKTDRQGHDLTSLLTEHVPGSTIKLTKVGDPARFSFFAIESEFTECNDAYVFGTAYVSGADLEVDAIYELTI